MKKILLLVAVSVMRVSCHHGEFMPKDGDILFCVAEPSAMSDAIVDATKTNDGIQYDHVALFVKVGGVPAVIEAVPAKGVVCRTFDDFMSNATRINGKPGITVKRPNSSIDIKAAISRAIGFIGLPYDWSYLPDNGKIYCSELIHECFRFNGGGHIFVAKPMSFRDENGQIPEFWVESFAKLGEPIPEGVDGTNPNDMLRDGLFSEVHRYF